MRSGAYVNSISNDPRDRNHLVACLSNYGVVSIFESFNAGESWQAIAGNLEENLSGTGNGPAVNWAAIRPYDQTTTVIIAATSTGLYFTPQTNGMSTVWTPTATEELGNVPCDMVVTRMSTDPKADRAIAVATHGRGTWWGEITALPGKPTLVSLISPRDERRGILPDTTLTWTPALGAVTYTVRLVCEDDTAGNAVYQGVQGASLKVQGLRQGPQRYTWSVEPYGGGGAGVPSAAWSFYTAIRPPTLLSPVQGATGVSPVVLTWERVPGALRYDVEVAANASFKPVLASATALADTTYALSGLESTKRYFWRVRSIDNDASGIFSDRQSFVTGTITSVTEKESTLELASPNPAQGTLSVTPPNGFAGRYVIEVMSLDGRLVRRMESEGGTSAIDVTDLAAGTYTVRVIAGVAVSAQQIVIGR
jgi:hypothetical protein